LAIKSSPDIVGYIISAACVLHSFIRQGNDRSANQTNTITDEPSGRAQIYKFFTASRRKSNITPLQLEKFLRLLLFTSW
jgi:hypothetical protein